MISIHMDLYCDAPNCHARLSVSDWDEADRNRLEDIGRMKGWNCTEGRHLCPECVRNPKRHLP